VIDVLSDPVLVLNRAFQPVHVTGVRRALCMLYVGVARALDREWVTHDFADWLERVPEENEPALATTDRRIGVPRVLVLSVYDQIPKGVVRLSRRNIFLRDGYRCQYCGAAPPQRELNLDHVFPRSRGGPTTWENLVCCCRRCNLEKGGRTPEESAMRLLRRPRRPGWTPALQLASFPMRYEEWRPFLASIPRSAADAE